MKFAVPALLAMALLVGPASAAREDRQRDELNRELAGRTAGPAERCVASSRLGSAAIYGDALLYRDGTTVWLNTVEHCPSLSRDPILVFDMFGSDLCENDTMRTVERGTGGMPGPICRLGKFTPYRKPR